MAEPLPPGKATRLGRRSSLQIAVLTEEFEMQQPAALHHKSAAPWQHGICFVSVTTT